MFATWFWWQNLKNVSYNSPITKDLMTHFRMKWSLFIDSFLFVMNCREVISIDNEVIDILNKRKRSHEININMSFQLWFWAMSVLRKVIKKGRLLWNDQYVLFCALTKNMLHSERWLVKTKKFYHNSKAI